MAWKEKKMIAAYLKESRIDACRIKIVIVPDGKSFSSTVTNLFKYCGKFDLIYCNKKTIIRLIEKKDKSQGYTCKRIASATKLRDAIAMIKNGSIYREICRKLIRKFNGIERIRRHTILLKDDFSNFISSSVLIVFMLFYHNIFKQYLFSCEYG